MTPKSKAKELVGKFYVNIPLRDCDNRRPHKLALIAVDEILDASMPYFDELDTYVIFWQEVKREILAL